MDRIPIVDTILEDSKGNILMLKRNFYPKNKLGLLGGFVDNDESLESAAIREVKEESGLDVEIIKQLGSYDYYDRAEKRLIVFVGKIMNGDIRASKEGQPVWINPIRIDPEDLAFPELYTKVIKDFLKYKA